MSKIRRRKNKNSDRHPIDEMLRFQYRWVRDFSTEHPDVWGVIGSGINAVYMNQQMIAHLPDLSIPDLQRLVMWQTVLDYQMQSVILILQHKLDSGLALLRMAAELSRDIHVVGNDQTRLNLWMEKEARIQEYRKVFKFDNSLPQAQQVYEIYKLCSSYGVHGHVSNNMFSELIGTDGQLAFLDVSEIGILQAVGTWLIGFAPMHHLCSREFFASRTAELFQQFSLWHDFELVLEDLVQSFHASLSNTTDKSRVSLE